jgi:8-oxo-dGTP pyrophosphatase MutT (NUDIX family)
MPRVVTCLLEHDGKILLLKRSNLVGTYRGLWGGVAGYIEKLEDPYDTAIKEIQEEVGISLDALDFICKGDPIEISDTYEGRSYSWIVYPFLFHIRSKEQIRLDWEHEEYRWVYSSEVKKFNTVPGLDEVVTKLLSASGII